MSDDISQSVRDRITSTSQVTDLVGKHIFADALPGDFDWEAQDAIVVQVPESTAHEDLSSTNRIHQSTVIVLAYGRDRTAANKLAKMVRDYALPANLRGRVEGMEWQEVTLIDGPGELIEPPPDGSERFRKLTKQDFVIWNSAV